MSLGASISRLTGPAPLTILPFCAALPGGRRGIFLDFSLWVPIIMVYRLSHLSITVRRRASCRTAADGQSIIFVCR